MANKTVFKVNGRQVAVPTDCVNEAGGQAYALTDAEALCQYVVTSTFSDSFYITAADQLAKLQQLCKSVDPVLVAKAAVYGHENGKMKDAPAYLLAHLMSPSTMGLFTKVFPRVITNVKMLCTFVQIVRSGVTGRKSFGSAAKRLIQNWLTSKNGKQLFLASIGHSDPSLVDILKMVHPKPETRVQEALFAYLLGKTDKYTMSELPQLTQDFELFKKDNSRALPDMDFRSLTNCNLTTAHWEQIALNMPWNTLRMNLNVLGRNGVFKNTALTKVLADKLGDKKQVETFNVFPYQLLAAYLNVDENVPTTIGNSLQQAMEYATKNVPVLGNRVGIAVDVSGSMNSPVTGSRPGAPPTMVMCSHVASLIASALSRSNKEAVVVSFGTRARVVPKYNSWDSVMTNTEKLAQEGLWTGYGTNAGAAMQVFNAEGKFDFIVYVSDCQSWVGNNLMDLWAEQKRGNKKTRLAEINVQAGTTVQAKSNDNSILNVGGFSDQVFDTLARFVGEPNVNFLDVVKSVEL